MKLNLGCGSQVPPGWINVDYALGAKLMKLPFFRVINRKIGLFNLDWSDEVHIHNLSTPFPWSDASADIVYCSHTLEHFSKQDGRNFLNECFRVLKPSGVIRIVVPDLRYIISQYNNGSLPADDLIQELGVLYEGSSNRFKKFFSHFIQYPHRCMYDESRLTAVLEEIGFGATPRKPFDSKIPDIDIIEREGRTINAVIVEGIKP